MRRAHKDTRMNSHECREGPTENAYVQGPEFCATSLFIAHMLKKEEGTNRGKIDGDNDMILSDTI